MKKNYISPSITVVQIETETILAASGATNSIFGMDRTPSGPGKSYTRSSRPTRYDFFEDDDF